MAFLILHQLFEQVLRDAVADALAVGRRLAVEIAGFVFRGEVGFEDFLDVLADAQGIEHLQVGKAVKEDDALDEAVGVVHLLDGFPCARFSQAPCIPSCPGAGNAANTG